VVAMLVNQSFIFPSENLHPNELKLGRKHLWKVLSKEYTFSYDPSPNMAATEQKIHIIEIVLNGTRKIIIYISNQCLSPLML
jgi:hypothetical protein